MTDFHPALIAACKNYSAAKFRSDLVAGIVVGIVALPLAIAFAIASGVSPTVGLITAVIGGFIVSACGGNSVQIGGPTGAFIVIIYNIIQLYGISGLAIATFMAGCILLLMGFFKLGTVIKFIPYPIVVGFTAGIALTIFSTQMPDFFGLTINEAVPGDFIGKWRVYIANFNTIDISTLLIGLLSLLIIILTPKVSKRIPGALTAIVLVTVVVWVMREVFGITGIQTIGDRFGNLTPELPEAAKIGLNMESVNLLLPSAFTIAMLGAIESLLSATVADGRTGDRTNCNTELIGQGLANVVVPIFGGIPVTGAIARTMTNITNGGRTPVAGIVHAVVLLAVFMFAMPLINHVPMSCLAAVLIMVSYNMSGWRTVVGMAHDPKGDIWVLVVTFLLTVIFNLTIAIEIGLLLAVVVFLRRITENTTIKVYGEQLDAAAGTDMTQHEVLDLKPGVSVYEIDGPFFFGAATKFDEIVRHSLQENPKVRIIRMRKVPFIDSTGLHNLQLLIESSHREGIRIVLSGVRDNVRAALHNAGIDSLVGAENICDHISKAVVVANSIADGELSDKMIAL
ncbi:STAS domain-containing protein [Muribaculaceae bacterium Isolate-113 (HZI)]|nr:STAS domain-containing protein [Muribaculaceae bacterium Isolate-114 (HZI)]ROT25392.1 STAS domain-containing protein [Muribaculaceae bacterium Isolate-113 (HZI)]RXE69753.1 STAS domain-containing protein [Muribaculaceae bacterium Isolate-001 (NCI)]